MLAGLTRRILQSGRRRKYNGQLYIATMIPSRHIQAIPREERTDNLLLNQFFSGVTRILVQQYPGKEFDCSERSTTHFTS